VQAWKPTAVRILGTTTLLNREWLYDYCAALSECNRTVCAAGQRHTRLVHSLQSHKNIDSFCLEYIEWDQGEYFGVYTNIEPFL